LAAKWVDKDTVLVEFWNTGEQRIREKADIGTNPRKQNGKGRAIENTEWMIGDSDERALCWDPFDVSVPDLEVDFHLREQGFEPKALPSGGYASIEIASLPQGNKFSGKTRQAGHVCWLDENLRFQIVFSKAQCGHRQLSLGRHCNFMKRRLSVRESDVT